MNSNPKENILRCFQKYGFKVFRAFIDIAKKLQK